jgi:hydroxylamine dehydrogenase
MTPSDSSNPKNALRSTRVLIIGLAAVIVVLGLALIAITIGRSGLALDATPEQVDALEDSDNACVTCHRRATPGIVEQYGHSTMAAAEVSCQDCHSVEPDYPGAVAHQDAHVLPSPTTAMCAKCHGAQVNQFNQSRHGLPAYVAMVGREGLQPSLLARYDGIPEAKIKPNEMRNALFDIEGPAVTRFACEGCHNIGKPAADQSIGQCQACHLRHEFSLEQARKPETCNACHIGPDHPQWEIYQESPHGIAYATGGHRWHWEAEPGTLTVNDFPAPTCATCHMSGFGASGATHDVGDRLTWFLFAPISDRRPSWEDNRVRMQNVCGECHNRAFVTGFYQDADRLTEAINAWVRESDEVIAPLREANLLTSAPFDEPVDFVHFDLWHHWGRTAKFGAWMQGPDYVQWHGAYEILKEMAELREIVQEKLRQHQTTEGGQ